MASNNDEDDKQASSSTSRRSALLSTAAAAFASATTTAATTALVLPLPASALLTSPNARLPRSPEAALRRSVPAVNPDVSAARASLESVAFKLRIPQRKPWDAMSADVGAAAATLADKSKALALTPPDAVGAAEAAAASAVAGCARVKGAIDARDADVTSARLNLVLADVAKLQLAQAPGLPYELPREFARFPRLAGRAVVELDVERRGARRGVGGNNSVAAEGFDLRDGRVSKTATLELTLDGYAAPLTAGNFLQNVVNGAYDGTPLGGELAWCYPPPPPPEKESEETDEGRKMLTFLFALLCCSPPPSSNLSVSTKKKIENSIPNGDPGRPRREGRLLRSHAPSRNLTRGRLRASLQVPTRCRGRRTSSASALGLRLACGVETGWGPSVGGVGVRILRVPVLEAASRARRARLRGRGVLRLWVRDGRKRGCAAAADLAGGCHCEDEGGLGQRQACGAEKGRRRRRRRRR